MKELDMRRGQYRRIYSGAVYGRRINSVGDFAERLFFRMVAISDDWGNLPGDALILHSLAVPLLRQKSEEDIHAGAEELCRANLLVRYSCDGTDESYLHIVDHISLQPPPRNGQRRRLYPPSPYDEQSVYPTVIKHSYQTESVSGVPACKSVHQGASGCESVQQGAFGCESVHQGAKSATNTKTKTKSSSSSRSSLDPAPATTGREVAAAAFFSPDEKGGKSAPAPVLSRPTENSPAVQPSCLERQDESQVSAPPSIPAESSISAPPSGRHIGHFRHPSAPATRDDRLEKSEAAPELSRPTENSPAVQPSCLERQDESNESAPPSIPAESASNSGRHIGHFLPPSAPAKRYDRLEMQKWLETEPVTELLAEIKMNMFTMLDVMSARSKLDQQDWISILVLAKERIGSMGKCKPASVIRDIISEYTNTPDHSHSSQAPAESQESAPPSIPAESSISARDVPADKNAGLRLVPRARWTSRIPAQASQAPAEDREQPAPESPLARQQACLESGAIAILREKLNITHSHFRHLLEYRPDLEEKDWLPLMERSLEYLKTTGKLRNPVGYIRTLLKQGYSAPVEKVVYTTGLGKVGEAREKQKKREEQLASEHDEWRNRGGKLSDLLKKNKRPGLEIAPRVKEVEQLREKEKKRQEKLASEHDEWRNISLILPAIAVAEGASVQPQAASPSIFTPENTILPEPAK